MTILINITFLEFISNATIKRYLVNFKIKKPGPKLIKDQVKFNFN